MRKAFAVLISNNKNENTIAQIFWSLFPAFVIANIVPTLSGIINGLIVGNAYSEAAMSSIGFAGPVTKIIGAIAVLVSNGGGIVYGQSLGRGDSDRIHRVFTVDVYVVLVVGVILTLTGEVFTPQITSLIGVTDDDIFYETVNYLRGLFFGIIPSLMIPSLVVFLNLGNEAKYGMTSSVIMAGVNLVLGLLNVYVIKGGLFVIGLSSAISQYVALAFLMRRFIKRRELGHLVGISGESDIIKDILRLGIPAAILEVGGSLRNIVLTAETLKVGGASASAAMGIFLSSSGLFCAVIPAVITATTTIVSITVGEQNAQLLKKETSYLLRISTLIFAVSGLIYAAFAPWISAIFGAEGNGIVYASLCIRLYCLELFLGSFFYVIWGIHQAIGRSTFSIIMQLLTSFLYAVIVIYVLQNPLGVSGIWSCYGIAVFMGSVTLVVHAWFKGGKLPRSVGDLLWLDEHFDVPDEDRLSITVNTLSDVVEVARTVQQFCSDRGIDGKRAMMMALCLEEMSGNIVSHGFTKAPDIMQKKLAIDISVAVREGEVIAKIRDNAPQFDPIKKLEIYKENEDDPYKNVGIRVVSKIAKDMKYQSTLGMNVLSVII